MISPAQEQRVRNAIRTTCLVQRLEKFALSEPDPQTTQPVKMSKEQVSAALGLLRKTLPDLSSAELSGPGGDAIPFVIFGEREAKDADAWKTQHAPDQK